MSLSTDFVSELKKNFSGDVRNDLATRILYSTDASIYQIEPLGIAIPKTQEDLQAAVELAVKYQVPILPRGAGSSLAGQAIGKALILDCSRWLNNLVDIDPEARTATVEPGLVLTKLNDIAAKHSLVFGPDPASAERATMGGVIGNNATGAHSIMYGMTVDHLISADVIMADGSLATWGSLSGERVEMRDSSSILSSILLTVQKIRSTYADDIKQSYPQTWRNSAGYRLNYLLPWSPSVPSQWTGKSYPANLEPNTFNLAHLLAGSEGTLAVIRSATVNLVPLSKHTVIGVLSYESIVDACNDVPRLVEYGPSAVELIPRMLIRLAKDVPAYASQVGWVDGDPAALMAVEFSGNRLAVLRDVVKSLGPDVLIAESKEDQSLVWGVRKVGLGIFDSRPADRRPVAFIEDCAIPVEQLGEFVRETDRILAAHNTFAAYYAHASAGCLHIRPMLDMKHGAKDLRPIAEAVLALTMRLGGSMTSEHGDGIARGEFLRQIYGNEVIGAMQLLKSSADPEGLLNPGKLIDAPPMDTHLRYGDEYIAQAWNPALNFSRNTGLMGAIEQCNGQGVCRKDNHVMCPSFQATREEGYSTRGRANLLRAMITVGTSIPGVEKNKREIESATLSALELCLACKGCKAECPSGVDMAKLKYEFQNEYYKHHRRKLRDYLFAYIDRFVRTGAQFGWLVNWIMSSRQIKQILGLAEARELPKFMLNHQKIETFRGLNTETGLLLRDTFTHFFEPEIEVAALKLLSACGVNVLHLPYFGAGRTLISKGFIEAGKLHAERILDSIQELDPQRNLPILGIEPSELYTLRDEFLDLVPHRAEEVESIADRAWLVDEWLTRPDEFGQLRVAKIIREYPHSKKPGKKIKNNLLSIHLHGHCYQKAQPPSDDGYPIGQEASAEMLRALGYVVETIPSGCCGMAGAFGYESEHYELSMQVGELVLFPEIRERRKASSNDRFSAPGTSCRAQMLDGTGERAEHPLVLAAELLSEIQSK
jgi:FAD/FMN-containing dehydrogenase/Fe-S oxidoreductase